MTKISKIILLVSVVALIIGFAAWVYTLNAGLLATSGMSNTFNWGLLIGIFAFLVGFGAGSQFVASYIVLANKTELLPYAKIAQVIALAGGIGAGVAIMIDLGNPFHIMAMLVGPNPVSPLTWDMVALTTFLVIALINVIMIRRQSRALKVWMALGAIAAFALQLVEGLLFALIQARVWWHSVIMPIDFIAVALVCGLALAAIGCAIMKKQIPLDALRSVAKMLIALVAIHLILAVIDLLIVVFQGSAASAAALAALGGNWVMYALELALPLAGAIVAGIALKQDDHQACKLRKLLIAAGVLVIIGIFFHRLMLLYPAFGAPTLFISLSNEPSAAWAIPASTGLYTHVGWAFAMAEGYVPNVIEWLCCLLPLGLTFAIGIIGKWFVYKE